jgi:hypothetical protein
VGDRDPTRCCWWVWAGVIVQVDYLHKEIEVGQAVLCTNWWLCRRERSCEFDSRLQIASDKPSVKVNDSVSDRDDSIKLCGVSSQPVINAVPPINAQSSLRFYHATR